MTRKEEIRQEAHRKYPYEGGTKGLICENSIPIFIQGAEWADKTMIDKAYEWIISNMPKYVKANRLDVFINNEDMANDFKRAMEE